MKKVWLIPLLVSVLLFAFLACATRETNPVKSDTSTSAYNPGANPKGYFGFVSAPAGGPFSQAVGMAVVKHDAIEARISVAFATRIDTATLASSITLVTTDGVPVALAFESTVGANTMVDIRPAADLDYNTTYVLSIQSDLLQGVGGDMLDLDGDGRGGETPDDNWSGTFTTFNQGDVFDDRDHDGVYDNVSDNDGDHFFTSNGVGEPFWDDSSASRDYNNVWDQGESYSDIYPNNGRYDAGEWFWDRNGDSVYNSNSESVQDADHNGYASLGEFFIDEDGDFVYDPDEEGVDLDYDYNGNGLYDVGIKFVPAGIDLWDPTSAPLKSVYVGTNLVLRRFAGFAEEFTDANADSIWNPYDSFLDIIANGVWDSSGEVLLVDVNGDGSYNPPTAGIVVPILDDVLPPAISGGLRYFIGNIEVFTKWLDVTIAIDVVDSLFDASGNRIEQALPGSALSESTVILRHEGTKATVPATVTYDNGAFSSTYQRLTIDPTDNLEAGQNYQVVFKAELIADAAGNKLRETGDVIYSFTTSDRTSDGGVVVEDIKRPTVTNFSSHNDYFLIKFSEEMDLSSLSAASIVVEYDGGTLDGSFEFSRVPAAFPTPPTGYATVVTFHPNHFWGMTNEAIRVRAAVRDLAGNNMAEDYEAWWD